MRWLIAAGIVLGAVALLAAAAAAVGSRLSRTHTLTREVRLPAAPETVWQTITDVDAFPAWRGDVTRVERLPDRGGATAWIEHGKNGRLTFVAERAEPPHLLVVRIADPDLPFGGTWTYRIAAVPGGSTLTITEEGEINNPLFRFMARFVFGYEATVVAYLSSLATVLDGR